MVVPERVPSIDKIELFNHLSLYKQRTVAQSAETVEYANCTSAEESDPPPPYECPGYTKQSDGEIPVIQELWGMQSTPSLPLLPGSLWPGMVAFDRTLSMG